MTLLSKRVEKAKKLIFSVIPNTGEYGTWGSNGNYYHLQLSHEIKTVPTPDGEKKITVFTTDCQQQCSKPHYTDRQETEWSFLQNCKGNEHRTICYHSLGAICSSFKEIGKLVSFFKLYESASRMAFGGKIAKIESKNGNGFVWCVVKEWPKKVEVLSVKENIDLMRGAEEGIE